MDYIVRYHFDLAVVASGNFNDNNDCVSGGALYVSTPGKGYNSLTVVISMTIIPWGGAMIPCGGPAATIMITHRPPPQT